MSERKLLSHYESAETVVDDVSYETFIKIMFGPGDIAEGQAFEHAERFGGMAEPMMRVRDDVGAMWSVVAPLESDVGQEMKESKYITEEVSCGFEAYEYKMFFETKY